MDLKGNTKTWFDSEVISVTNKHYDFYNKFKIWIIQIGNKDLVTASKVILENLIQKQRILFIQEKLQENSKNVIRLQKTLKSLGQN